VINHARTLLLNANGPHEPVPGVAGDEYIPVYESLALTAPFASVYRVLYGEAPDTVGSLYRTAQYMAILHATEFSAYLAALDTRITYEPRNSAAMSAGYYGTRVSDYSGQRMTVVGSTWNAAAKLGRAVTTWQATALTTSRVEVQNLTTGASSTQTRVAGTPLRLTDSDLMFTLDGGPLTPDDYWRVVHTTPVAPDLSALMPALVLPSSDVTLALYGTELGDAVEPYKTFYNLAQHYALPYQLSGVLLAYLYRLEALRT